MLLVLAILGTLAFAWSSSSRSKAESKAQSGSVMVIITPFLELFVGEGNVTVHMVRKLAHFTEFTALGGELFLLMAVSGRRTLQAAVNCLFIGLCAAVTDETIQIFSNRGSQVKDVVLDFAGVCTGVFLAWILCVFLELISKRLHRGKKKEETA